MSVWRDLAELDLRDWRGLPERAPYADFDAHFERVADAYAVGLLGRTNVPARYRVYAADGFPLNLRAWYRGDQLVLVDGELPALSTPVADLRAGWGEPAGRLDGWFDVLHLPGGVLVFPDRGAAVLAGPEGQALWLAVFSPCDLAGYVETLHPSTRVRELPLAE